MAFDPISILYFIAMLLMVWFASQWQGRELDKKRRRELDVLLEGNLDRIHELTGQEFENVVARIFERHGWRVQLTKATGDQGADLIAKKQGRTYVVQCKRYTKSVGTKAVQEVIAGRIFYGGTHMAVVASSGFSKGAVTLARRAGVKLIDFSNLESIKNL